MSINYEVLVHLSRAPLMSTAVSELASRISPGASQSNSAMLHLSAWGSSNCNSASCCAQSCPTLCNHMDCSPPGSSVHGVSPGKNNGLGCHALLQGIFSTQGSSPGLLHCRWILYHLSHQGSPRILERVAYPFSRGSSQPRDQAQVSCIKGGFFTI